jgi:hypothetical protein
MFTKLMKPIAAILRRAGVKMVLYLDDMLIMKEDPALLRQQVQSAIWLLQRVGFKINQEKSVITPTKEIEFLGFQVNSETMKITLPSDKVEKIQEKCRTMVTERLTTVRELASVIGQLVAAVRAIAPAPLHYRQLQLQKARELYRNGQSYEATLKLTPEAIQELMWWSEELKLWNGRSIIRPSPDLTLRMTSDASKRGWGATCDGVTTQGVWSQEEREHHINVLEMKAACFAVKSFTKARKDVHIHIQTDNITTVANINKMGNTRSMQLVEVAKELWEYCLDKGITITAEYLPGKLNIQADMESRDYVDYSNWRLDPMMFAQINRVLGPLELDLFADRLNTQLPRFMSWKPDPNAEGVDAFTRNWKDQKGYVFPPICMIGRCLAKIENDKAVAVVITPVWNTQTWYGKILQMLIDYPILLPMSEHMLTGPTGQPHPLAQDRKFQLAAWKVSGDVGERKVFLSRLSESWASPEGLVHNPLTTPPGVNGVAGVWKNKWIPFEPLWQI